MNYTLGALLLAVSAVLIYSKISFGLFAGPFYSMMFLVIIFTLVILATASALNRFRQIAKYIIIAEYALLLITILGYGIYEASKI